MPEERKLTESVARVGKQALASDTGQVVVGAVAEKVQELALATAEDLSQTIQEKAAKAAGRKPPSRQASVSKTKQTEQSALSTIKDKAGDAASAVASGPEKVGSGVKKVGSAGKKAAGAVAEIPAPVLAAATGAAVVGGAALAREHLQKKKSSAKKSSAKKSSAKKSSAKKSSAKKSSAKKGRARKSPARSTKASAKKSPERKRTPSPSKRKGTTKSTTSRTGGSSGSSS
jgi:hypothetical protein